MALDPSTVAATTIAVVGAVATVIGSGVALYNSRKAVQWKRAELANTYIRDFNSNKELVFAGQCIDWMAGRLVVPEGLRAYLDNERKFIEHDRILFERALSPGLGSTEMDDDPRIQLYRTSIDAFLSWLSLVSSAIDRKLIVAADIEDVGYWVAKLETDLALIRYAAAFGYRDNMVKLIKHFRMRQNTYKNWRFPVIWPRSSHTDLPGQARNVRKQKINDSRNQEEVRDLAFWSPNGSRRRSAVPHHEGWGQLLETKPSIARDLRKSEARSAHKYP